MSIKPFLSIVVFVSLILVGVSGCDTRFKEEEVLSQYLEDLNRSQDIVTSPLLIEMPTSLPALRNRRHTLSEFDIGFLDFLSLQQCDVGIVAGRKNSILGKVMPDSQRFLYELDIIRAIEACDINDALLKEELLLIAKHKKSELYASFNNAIFNGEEGESFFSLSNGFLPFNESTENRQELISALNRLLEIKDNLMILPIVDSGEFERDLQVLMNNEYAGKLLYTLARLTGYLNQVSDAVERVDHRNCGAPIVYLKQQFDKHYVEKIQPYMGRLNRSAYQILPLINRLSDLTLTTDSEMVLFLKQLSLDDRTKVWGEYQQSSQKHARAWSELFKSCSVLLN